MLAIGTYSTTVILMIIIVVMNTILSVLLAWTLYLAMKHNDRVTFRKLFLPVWLAGLAPAALASMIYEKGHGIPLLLVLRDLSIVWAVIQMVSVMWLTTKYKVIKKR